MQEVIGNWMLLEPPAEFTSELWIAALHSARDFTDQWKRRRRRRVALTGASVEC